MADVQPPVVFNPACGACAFVNRSVARFCGNCGKPLGQGLVSALDRSVAPLPAERDWGGVAGRLNFALGLLLGREGPNDSLICVAETRHAQMKDHVVVAASHGSMLLSARVAGLVDSFLRTGAFRS